MQNVVTYDAVVGVDNADLALMPGMTATTQHHRRSAAATCCACPTRRCATSPGGLPSAGTSEAAGAGRARASGCCATGKPSPSSHLGLDDDSFTEIVKGELQPGDPVIIAEDTRRRRRQARTPAPRF